MIPAFRLKREGQQLFNKPGTLFVIQQTRICRPGSLFDRTLKSNHRSFFGARKLQTLDKILTQHTCNIIQVQEHFSTVRPYWNSQTLGEMMIVCLCVLCSQLMSTAIVTLKHAFLVPPVSYKINSGNLYPKNSCNGKAFFFRSQTLRLDANMDAHLAQMQLTQRSILDGLGCGDFIRICIGKLLQKLQHRNTSWKKSSLIKYVDFNKLLWINDRWFGLKTLIRPMQLKSRN